MLERRLPVTSKVQSSVSLDRFPVPVGMTGKNDGKKGSQSSDRDAAFIYQVFFFAF